MPEPTRSPLRYPLADGVWCVPRLRSTVVLRAVLPLMAASALAVSSSAHADEPGGTTPAVTSAPAAPPVETPAAPAATAVPVAPPNEAAPAGTTPTGTTPVGTTPSGAQLPDTVVTDGRPIPREPGRGPDPTASPDAAPVGAPDPGTQATDPSLIPPGVVELRPIGSAAVADFDIPPFLLPIYQAAGTAYGIPWEVLASINRIETDYGRNLAVSYAGALGWMQFMPATWATYGVDANQDGVRDPWNPADAIFAAARYLQAAGAERDLSKAVFAYNHADWYVKDVLDGAGRIAALPPVLVDALTGLTDGIFPIDADPSEVRYDDIPARDGETTAVIKVRPGARLVAVQDGIIEAVGANERLGRYIRIRDAYGNRYVYGHLSRLQARIPVLRRHGGDDDAAHAEAEAAPAPTAAASTTAPDAARATSPDPEAALRRPTPDRAEPTPAASSAAPGDVGVTQDEVRRLAYEAVVGKQAAAKAAAAVPRAAERGAAAKGPIDLADYFSIPYDLDAAHFELRPLEAGRSIVAGTVLAYASNKDERAAINFEIRPAGEDAPRIDPAPFLDGWQLADATDFVTARAREQVAGSESAASQIGQIILMSKPALSRRVLTDKRISIYECGRTDIRAGLIDRRVLALLAVLAEKGVRPVVTSLMCGHGQMTASGNVSEHSTGDAVDIAGVYGTTIAPSTQGAGSVTDRAVREILKLQGTMRPHQIITLNAYPGYDNTVALGDHDDHIHVGYSPEGVTAAGGTQLTAAVWGQITERLARIKSPTVRVGRVTDAQPAATKEPTPARTPAPSESSTPAPTTP